MTTKEQNPLFDEDGDYIHTNEDLIKDYESDNDNGEGSVELNPKIAKQLLPDLKLGALIRSLPSMIKNEDSLELIATSKGFRFEIWSGAAMEEDGKFYDTPEEAIARRGE